MKDVFWARYHLCLTPEEWPGDRLVSKLFKAVEKRTLEVTDLWQVKSMLHQKTHSAKRRRIGENLYLQDNEESAEPEVGDAPSYFNRMRVYFMALAIVGASPLPTAPAAAESLGDDSTLYVQVPWDLLMKYQQRAEKFYTAAPSVGKFRSLVRLDLEERAQWTRLALRLLPLWARSSRML